MPISTLSNFDWMILLSVSWGLFILIWVIQLVHYPSFHFVDSDIFSEFHKHHTRSITVIVMPLMLCELVNVLWLLKKTEFSLIFLILSGLVVGIWLCTFLVSVPLHNQLVHFKNANIINQLIRTNWLRTILWTAKVGIVTVLFLKSVKIL